MTYDTWDELFLVNRKLKLVQRDWDSPGTLESWEIQGYDKVTKRDWYDWQEKFEIERQRHTNKMEKQRQRRLMYGNYTGYKGIKTSIKKERD